MAYHKTPELSGLFYPSFTYTHLKYYTSLCQLFLFDFEAKKNACFLAFSKKLSPESVSIYKPNNTNILWREGRIKIYLNHLSTDKGIFETPFIRMVNAVFMIFEFLAKGMGFTWIVASQPKFVNNITLYLFVKKSVNSWSVRCQYERLQAGRKFEFKRG